MFPVDAHSLTGFRLETSSHTETVCDFIRSKQQESRTWNETYFSLQTKVKKHSCADDRLIIISSVTFLFLKPNTAILSLKTACAFSHNTAYEKKTSQKIIINKGYFLINSFMRKTPDISHDKLHMTNFTACKLPKNFRIRH